MKKPDLHDGYTKSCMEEYSRMEDNYPKEMRELMAGERSGRKRWQQTRAPVGKTRLNNLSLQLE
jgi:hypothetical protein